MKIGIPRALLYYYYFPFWESFFNNLGCELVVSDKTSEMLINKGIKNSVSEICVPIKVYIGHVFNLLDKGVDYIYVPRFISIKKNITFCPKFLGLPDMIINSLKGVEGKILSNYIKARSDDISNYKNYLGFIDKLGVSRSTLKKAAKKARKVWLNFREKSRQGLFIDQILNDRIITEASNNEITIGVVGYVYNVYDQFISMDFIDRLREMKVNVLTFEMLETKKIEEEVDKFTKRMFWEFTNKLLGAGYHFIHSPQVDGVIHITAFGCGPDSVLGPFLDTEAEDFSKPLMRLRIDEQTGESHLITRIEAFTDMIKAKKEEEGSFR